MFQEIKGAPNPGKGGRFNEIPPQARPLAADAALAMAEVRASHDTLHRILQPMEETGVWGEWKGSDATFVPPPLFTPLILGMKKTSEVPSTIAFGGNLAVDAISSPTKRNGQRSLNSSMSFSGRFSVAETPGGGIDRSALGMSSSFSNFPLPVRETESQVDTAGIEDTFEVRPKQLQRRLPRMGEREDDWEEEEDPRDRPVLHLSFLRKKIDCFKFASDQYAKDGVFPRRRG